MFTARLLGRYAEIFADIRRNRVLVNFHRWYLTLYYLLATSVVERRDVYRGEQDKENDVALGSRRHRRSMHSPRTTAAILCRS